MQATRDVSAGLRAMGAAMAEDRRRERELAQAPEASQVRAARAMLDWTEAEVAVASGVTVASVRKIERGITRPSKKAMGALKAAFDAAGVLFIAENGEGPGVRLRKGET